MKNTIQTLLNLNLSLIELKKNSKIPRFNNWQTGNKLITKAQKYEHNIGVLCGTPLNGGYLIVIDVDPRNGGDIRNFKKHFNIEFMDDTFVVKTGNKGYHYYYLSKEPLPCFSFNEGLLKGIDIKAKGGQVVAPPSIHPVTNKAYIIGNNPSYIELLDDNIFQFLKNHRSNKTNKEVEIVTEGGRNNYLTAQAGKYKRAGIEGDALLDLLLSIDKKKCKPPLQDESIDEIKAIIKSASKWETIDYDVFKTDIKTNVNSDTTKTNFKLHYNDAEGLIKEIANDALQSSIRQYPQFALASALAIMSSVAQGSYLAPDLYDATNKGSSLSLYQICTAPASAGKDHYRRVVTSYLKKVNPYLIASIHGSLAGMLTDFFAFNSKISVIDEVQDYFNEMITNRFKQPILSQIKELYNHLESIPPQLTKTLVFPEINFPYYSLFGVGTTSGIKKHLKGNIVSGGLLSRFIIWPHEKVVSISPKSDLKIDSKIIDHLTKIFKVGDNIGFNIDPMSNLKLLTEYSSGKSKNKEGINHLHNVEATKKMKFDDDANAYMLDYRRTKNDLYLDLANKATDDSDASEASLIDRSFQTALKIASLHALGRGSIFLSLKDCVWATNLVDDLLKDITNTVNLNSKYEENVQKIMLVLKKETQTITASQLRQKVSIRNTKHFHQSLFDCVTSFENVILLNHENKKIVINDAFLKKYINRVPKNVRLLYKL